MRRLDWAGLMRAGMRGLGLSPAAFWALTPAELGLLLGLEARGGALGRAGLEALMTRYPDAGPTQGESDERS